MEKLTIIYTYQCNYKCPFCILGIDKLNKIKECKLWTNESKEKCFRYILDNDIEEISIMGGEPLLYPNECTDIINFCKNKNINIKVYTNISLLTPSLVNFFNKNNIFISFSINYYGYKNIDHLIKKSKHKDIINLINSLKYRNIRTVYNKNYSLAIEASILHHLFSCNINMSCDIGNIQNINYEELDWLEIEINKLYKYNSDISWFKLVPSGNMYTNIVTTFYPNGTIIKDSDRKNYDCIYYGHPRLYKDMSPDIYNRYMCIANSLLPKENNNFNSCIYS